MEFNPNDSPASESGLFGLPFTRAQSKLVVIPVPWETTTSYGHGAALGPELVLVASRQVDLFDIETGDAYRHGYFLEEFDEEIVELGKTMKRKAHQVVAAIEVGQENDPIVRALQDEVNQASRVLNERVYHRAREALAEGKIAAVLGGDHSCPLGLMRAISETCGADWGILHLDAHADLRDSYQGFQHSHASIMRNVATATFAPQKIAQVGIRDFSPDEYSFIQESGGKIETWFDVPTKRRLARGETWQSICDEVAASLPYNVYLSFDVDGLTPDLCPNTGTPVPGGLDWNQALCLLATVAESGRRIVGFDLCEVAGDDDETEWDGNVGARLLFKMCGWTMISNGHKPMQPPRIAGSAGR